MKRTPLTAIALLLFPLLLTSCGSSDDIPESDVTGAYDATEWTTDLSLGEWTMQRLRPSGLLGVYATQFLMHASSVHGALTAIRAHTELYFDDRLDRDESFQLLEDLGATLQVNITDMLNRSPRRADAFNNYLNELTNQLRESHAHRDALEEELEDIRDERREARKDAGNLQRALNKALREQDYASAGSIQEELIEAEGDLAKVTAREDETDSIIDLFEDLIDIGEERVIAMEQNREAILAGIMVVDVPGLDDLGIIKDANRRELRDRRSIFDPSADWAD